MPSGLARGMLYMMGMNESLEKVEHDLGFASDGLREALHKASAVEAMVLLPIIGQVAAARNDVAALIAARATDAAGGKARQP